MRTPPTVARSAILALIGLFLSGSPVTAGPVTITWTSGWGWYNGDILDMCQTSNWTLSECDFFLYMESLGIPATQPSNVPVTLSVTMDDVLPTNGAYQTLFTIHLEVGRLSLLSRAQPGYFVPGTIFSSFDPNLPPLAGKWHPSYFQVDFPHLVSVGSPSSNLSLGAFLLQQPPGALNAIGFVGLTHGCCDWAAPMTVTALTVPESSPLSGVLSAVPTLLVWWQLRSRKNRRMRTLP